MWLGLVLLFIIVLAVIGGAVVGGIYAVVLLPIAAILILGGLISGMWRRANDPQARNRQARRDEPDNTALPHSGRTNTAETPATPDQISDARRGQI